MKFLKTHYGRAIDVITSDTVNIPNPAGLGSTGNCTDSIENKLVDNTANFTSNLVGSIVINNTEKKIANVLNVEDDNVLVLDADVFASGNSYSIYNSNNNQGCSLYIPAQTPASIKALTVGGDIVEFTACGDLNSSMILPVSVLRVFNTGTGLNNLIALW